jgi:outer membrane receptor protein involved in Fe transport
MGNNRKLQFAIRAAIATASATAGVPLAYSQVAAPEPADALQEVIVTGSRLTQSPNEVSISPVISVTSTDIAQTGYVRAEDILNNLPQVVAENSSGQSISSNGTATISLRGLGSERTLVLIDGIRMPPGAGLGTYQQPDINQLPADLIERVDVLTGGASAVYGADAVAGVVNFILNTHFEGVKLDTNYGFGRQSNSNSTELGYLSAAGQPLPPSTTDAGFNKDFTFVAGSNFADGKGNATVYAGYLQDSPAVGYQYDYAGCTLNTPSELPGPGKLKCGGSSSSATGRFLELGATANSPYATLADNTVSKNGNFDPYSAADSYNYGALSYLQRQAERYTAGSFLTYDINDYATVYSEFMFARNTSTAQYGPSGLFAFGTPTISCSNPLLTTAELATLCSPANIAANQATFGTTGNNILLYVARRSVESGPRLDNYTSNAYHQVLGVKGKWGDAWSYNVYGSVGITTFEDIEGGFLGTQEIANALNVIPNPATGGVPGVAAGAPVCAAALPGGTAPTCVPWNIWSPGGVTPAQLSYLEVASTYAVKATEYIVDASATGDLGKYGVQLPTASSGLVVNVGAEYREERYNFDPDQIFGSGDASGGDGAVTPIDGGFHVGEFFTEARLPLLNDMPGAYDLSFDAGYRYSSYTSGFVTNTFKAGLEWAPVTDAKIRGGFNRAIRAPSIGDLFAPAVVGAGGTADPCWGAAVGQTTPGTGTVNGHTFAFCENTGVTTAEFGHILANPAAQINTTAGGNPNLKPEIADTYTFGVVLTPRYVNNFVTSVDFYRIVINDTIQSLTSNTVINNCGLTGSAQLCGLIHRGAGTGSLWFNNSDYVNTNEVNIGTLSTKGIDLSSVYHVDLGPQIGKLTVNLAGSRPLTFAEQPLPGGGSYDCVGYFGTTCGGPEPKWRHILNTTWGAPWYGLDFTARWRYIGPSESDRVSQNPQLSQEYFAPTAHIGGYSYIDLSASVPIASTGASIRVGVNNLMDKQPPIVASGNYSDCPNATCNDNTWVGTYDTLGRYLYVHASMKF